MPEPLHAVILRSIYVSSMAALLAFIVGSFIVIILLRMPARVSRNVLSVFEGLVGIPPIVVGVFVYMLVYPGGPLGPLKLLYTPTAMIIGEFLVALPLAVAFTYRPLESLWRELAELVESLGAPRFKAVLLVLRESPPILLTTYIISFSRSIGELGVALIVGGGIDGVTNVMTTAIALETSLGNYEVALKLGIVLVSIAVSLIIALRLAGAKIVEAV
ncbi:MAG: ABC transporter permease [Thermoprotei archaeon]|nr:ABC transporter permease [Thermoprotei archaeon]